MKNILFYFFLIFSLPAMAELPNSLFGVKILDNYDDYLVVKEVIKENKQICNQNERTTYWSWGEIDTIYPEEINISKMKKSPMFHAQCISLNKDSKEITLISGKTMWNFYNDFEKSKVNEFGLVEHTQNHLNLINNLSILYEINPKKFKPFFLYNKSEVSESLQMINYFFFKRNKEKFLISVTSTLNKVADPQKEKLLGIGLFVIHLVSEKNNHYEQFNKFIKNKDLRDMMIKPNELDKYLNLITSGLNSF